MSTPEERLAALLHSTDVPVRGDGLSRIQARVARRTRVRRVVVPLAGVSVTALAAGLFLLGGQDDRSSLQPGVTPTTTTASGFFCYAPIQEGSTCPPSETPPPAPEPTVPSDQYVGPSLSDYTSADKDDVVRHWLATVAIAGAPQRHACESCDVVPIGVGGRHVGDAVLARSVSGTTVTYTLVGVGTDELAVTAPVEGDRVTSPLTVRGTLQQGVDENVKLTLLRADGQQIAAGGAPAGSAMPWSGTLTWSDTSWLHGAVVGQTFSPKDDTLTRLFAVPVTRSTAGSGNVFAGLVDGHVSLFDETGAVVRQLTYPPTRQVDRELAWNGTSLLWTRATNGVCGGQLNRLDGRTTSTVTTSTTSELRTPQLSDDGTWTAWLEQPCDGSESLVVRHGPTPAPTFGTATGTRLLAIRDDGALLLGDAAHTLLIPPGKTGGDAIDLRTAGCVSGPADFDGITTNAWAQCGSRGQLVRYEDDGTALSHSPLLAIPDPPTLITLQADEALFWLAGGDTVGVIAHYKQGGQVTTVVSNAGCSSVSEPKGCVREPSW